jgi:hypothetical protein
MGIGRVSQFYFARLTSLPCIGVISTIRWEFAKKVPWPRATGSNMARILFVVSYHAMPGIGGMFKTSAPKV